VGWWGTEAGSLETRLPRYRDALWLFPTAVRKLRAREAEWGKELGVRPLEAFQVLPDVKAYRTLNLDFRSYHMCDSEIGRGIGMF
jgi:hypothetical protein